MSRAAEAGMHDFPSFLPALALLLRGVSPLTEEGEKEGKAKELSVTMETTGTQTQL